MKGLISVNDLKTYFFNKEGIIPAVDGVSFEVLKGQTFGIVGESGSGKSVTALSIMRIIQDPPGKIVNGEIFFEGKDLLLKTRKEMHNIRGNEIAMIFQDPLTALNPVYTIGNQIEESFILHQKLNRKSSRVKAIEMLSLVGMPSPKINVDEYPHRLSGGMQQRAMIAMALACKPKLLIADEPTTALDVTIQAQILYLIESLKKKLNMTVLMITHDFGIISEVCDQVCVMYAGKIMEKGSTISIFDNPMHPYTEKLLTSIPSIEETKERLPMIEGVVPNPAHLPNGCRFHPRCPYVERICKDKEPPILKREKNHYSACWLNHYPIKSEKEIGYNSNEVSKTR